MPPMHQKCNISATFLFSEKFYNSFCSSFCYVIKILWKVTKQPTIKGSVFLTHPVYLWKQSIYQISASYLQCMMHDACYTLVDLIFVRTVNIHNLSLVPCVEVAKKILDEKHETDKASKLPKNLTTSLAESGTRQGIIYRVHFTTRQHLRLEIGEN